MATYSGYSEQELADKAMILQRCCVTEEDMPMYDEVFGNGNTYYTSMLSITPTGRCSDGKFRSFYDYIDFLFPDPTIEALVAASNIPSRVFVTTLDFSVANSIRIRMDRI